MSLKVKLISSISSFILTLCLLIVGVWTAGTQTINLKGSVNFNIEDSTFYIKDIRINCDDLIGEGSTIENFMPGFVNNSFELNLGTITSTTGSVAVQIDIVNTTGTVYSASSQSSISNATLSVSGTIEGDNVPLENVATYNDISGTIQIIIQTTDLSSINLDNITIELNEKSGYTATINIVDDSIHQYSSELGVAINNSSDVTGFNEFESFDQWQIILYNVETIAITNFRNVTIRATDNYTINLSSNAGFSGTLDSNASDFLGWYTLTQDTTFTITISY